MATSENVVYILKKSIYHLHITLCLLLGPLSPHACPRRKSAPPHVLCVFAAQACVRGRVRAPAEFAAVGIVGLALWLRAGSVAGFGCLGLRPLCVLSRCALPVYEHKCRPLAGDLDLDAGHVDREARGLMLATS